MAFGDCQTPEPAPLTPDEICQGFAKCGQPGLRLNPTNITRVIAYLEALAGTDINTLAAALCENPIFQQCVLDLTTASTHVIESVVALPASAPEGSEFCLIVTVTEPVVNAALNIPVSLLPVEEQALHNYTIPPFVVIAVGETEGSVCVTTTNDAIDEPDLSLVFHLDPTPRLPGYPGGNYAVTVTDNDATVILPPEGGNTETEGVTGAPVAFTYGQFTTTLGAFPTLAQLNLPVGMTFTDNGDGTYTLGGVFPAPGSTVVTITATYPGASNVSITDTVTALCLESVVPVIPDIEEAASLPFTYTSPAVTGSAPFTLAPDEALPASAAFTDNGDGTFTIDGPVDVAGTYEFNVIATNDCGDETPIPVTLEIAPPPPALNPADTDGQIALSNGNKTATKAGGGLGWRSSRSATSHAAGKFYYEWTAVEFTDSFIGAGFATADAPLVGYIGSDAEGISLVTNGEIFALGVGTPTMPALVEGDIVGMAIDIDAGEIWVSVNGGDWNGSPTADPETGAEGIALDAGMTTGSPPLFVGVSVQLAPSDQVTVNFGVTAFAFPAPTGFADWG